MTGASHFGRKTEEVKKQKLMEVKLKGELVRIMTPSEKARVQKCVKELSEILYRNTPSEKCQSLEGIEKTVREHLLESVGPEMAFFLSNKKRKRGLGKSE